MRRWAIGLSALVGLACENNFPGRQAAEAVPVRPSHVLDFAVLYAANCAGCHGAAGRNGASVELADPLYLAFADEAVLQKVTANGVPGTSMPAFAQSAGGALTEAQVEALVRGMRQHWAKPDALSGVEHPPYAADAPGSAASGALAYRAFCARCHGEEGRGGPAASSIVDPVYLALVSPQHLRTTVLVGRPNLGAPDWRGDLPGKPMTAEDVSDVVAWLTSHRVAFPGQPYPSARANTGGLP